MSRVLARLTAVAQLLRCAVAIPSGLACGAVIAVAAGLVRRARIALVPLRDRAERAMGAAAC